MMKLSLGCKYYCSSKTTINSLYKEIYFYFLVPFFFSCQQPCEPFDFGRLNDSVIFYDRYIYSCEDDTVELFFKETYHTTTYSGYGVCLPKWELSFCEINEGSDCLFYDFHYLRENTTYSKTKFAFMIMGETWELEDETLDRAMKGEIVCSNQLGKFNILSSVLNEGCARIRNLVVLEFVTSEGKRWKLADVGNFINVDDILQYSPDSARNAFISPKSFHELKTIPR